MGKNGVTAAIEYLRWSHLDKFFPSRRREGPRVARGAERLPDDDVQQLGSSAKRRRSRHCERAPARRAVDAPYVQGCRLVARYKLDSSALYMHVEAYLIVGDYGELAAKGLPASPDRPFVYLRRGATWSGGVVDDLAQAERWLRGEIKWDGCSRLSTSTRRTTACSTSTASRTLRRSAPSLAPSTNVARDMMPKADSVSLLLAVG